MQQPAPKLAEPTIPQSGEGSALRGFVYGGLIVLLAAGGWARFSDRIGTFIPGLAAPETAKAPAGAIRGLIELNLIPASQEGAAIQAMRLPSADSVALQQAASRRRVRLVQMPIYENDGGAGGLVQVSSGGMTRMVRLSTTPTVVTLPITHAGTVSFRVIGGASPGGLGMGAITLGGPIGLPPLSLGQVLELGVIAQ